MPDVNAVVISGNMRGTINLHIALAAIEYYQKMELEMIKTVQTIDDIDKHNFRYQRVK